MGVSILIGFSIINHPFWGTPIFGFFWKDPYGILSDVMNSLCCSCRNQGMIRPSYNCIFDEWYQVGQTKGDGHGKVWKRYGNEKNKFLPSQEFMMFLIVLLWLRLVESR